MTFHETLDRHLRAIQSRDLPGLIDTLPAEHLTLVMSDGRVVRTVKEFAALHKDWFASSTWSLCTELISIVEGNDLALAVLRLDYRDRPANGPPIHEVSCLTLGFQRQGDRWVMVYDQNTPVKIPKP